MDVHVEACLAELRLELAVRVHDGPLQLLAVAIQELDGPTPDIERAQHLLRSATRELRSTLEAPEPMVTAAAFCGSLERWATIVLPPGTSLHLDVVERMTQLPFLILESARELVTNAGRHGDATTVAVTVSSETASMALTVEDDGRGIAIDWTPGYGLSAMYRRVHDAGGTLDHRPRMSGGTRAVLRLPL